MARAGRPPAPLARDLHILPLIASDSPLVKLLADKAKERERVYAGREQAAPSPADQLQLDPRHLAYILNTSFWASLRYEEGRPARCAMTIADRTVPGGLRFGEPIMVTQESIVRLSPALGQALAAVELSPDGMPQIWGLLEAPPLWQPVFRIFGPGYLVVSQDKEVIGMIRGGETHLIKSGPYSLMSVVGSILDPTSSPPSPDVISRGEHLLKIAATLHRHGKGGTILVVPPTSGSWPDSVRLRYSLDARSASSTRARLEDLDESLGERAEHRHRASGSAATGAFLIPMKTKPRSALSDLSHRLLVQIGQLSATEGAVVLGNDLSIFGFGADLNPADEDCTLSVVDSVTGVAEHARWAASLGNGRYARAARFVNQFPDCLAFVSSPEGGLMLLAWVTHGRPLTALTRLEELLVEY
jgi:hypothetical protein